MSTRTYAARPYEGCPGTGMLDDALPGSRLDISAGAERDARMVQALVKMADGTWGWEVTVGGTVYPAAKGTMNAKQVEWWCFKHQWNRTAAGEDYPLAYTFTGSVQDRVTADNFCTRCGGAGRIGKYSHIDDGLCFDCHGTGTRGRR